MFGQAQGFADFRMTIFDPNGNVFLSQYNPGSPYLVQKPCRSGDTRAFYPWGSEV